MLQQFVRLPEFDEFTEFQFHFGKTLLLIKTRFGFLLLKVIQSNLKFEIHALQIICSLYVVSVQLLSQTNLVK